MKHTAIMAAIVLTLLLSISGFGQEASDISQLKEQIQRLELVDRDPSTSAEVRGLNRRFLLQRRAQLRSLLQKEIKALQSYRSTVGSSLSTDENTLIEASIQKLTLELAKLEGESGNTSTVVAAAQTANQADEGGGAQSTAMSAPVGFSASPTVPAGATVPQPMATSTAPNVVPPMTSTPTATSSAQAAAPPGCELYRQHPKTFSLVDRYVCNLIESVTTRKNGDQARGITANPLAGLELDPDFTRLVIIMEAKKGRAEELIRAEEARVDKQTGSDSSTGATTSLVTKGNVPAILGFAVENGALTKDTSGSTVTFRGNPVGILKAFAGKGLISGFDSDDATSRFLRRFSFGVSFDTDRGPQTGVFTGTKQQISGFSGRAVLYDKRDPRRGEYKQDWENFLATSAQDFLQQDEDTREVLLDTQNIARPVWKDPALIKWYDDTQRALAAASPADVEGVFIERLNQLPLDDLAPDTTSALAAFETKFKIYLRDRNSILKKVGKAGVITFDYTNQRNVNSPNLSNFKLIGEKGFHNGRIDLTGNTSLTIFDSKPAALNLGRLRDIQGALQLDGTFGSAEKSGVFVLSFAYKYQHLAENTLTPEGLVVPNTKGDINMGQLKLTVPIKGLGIRFPLSLTFANRTELIKEKEVRANFGFTFDLDTIFAKFKPF
jgi:hypothetical protein